MIKFKVVKSLDEVVIDKNLPVFCDIETDGLYKDTRLIQLYQANMDTVILLDTDILNITDIKQFLKDLHTVWYNASYDLGTLNIVTKEFDDLFYLTKLAYPHFNVKLGYSLDKVIYQLKLGNIYDDLKIDKKAMQKAGYVKGAYLSQNQLLYAALDVYILSLLWNNEKIQAIRNTNIYKLDIASLRYSVQYQQNGLPINREALKIELDNAIKQQAEYQKELGDLNVNSTPQCQKALGTTSTDSKTLAKLISEGNRLAYLIKMQRKVIKSISFLKSWDYDRVYTKFNPAGAITGRYTSTGGKLPGYVNVQQITRNLQYLFNVGKHSNNVVLSADYSTLEIRLACAIFNDKAMYKQLMNNEDLHTSMAKLVTGKSEITKEDRTNAKAVNFGYLFGMSAITFKEYALDNYGLVFTQEQCDNLRKAYFKKYPDIKQYHNNVWSNYKNHDFVYTTALGRKVKPKLGTDGINGPVQGTGVECTKLAVHYLIKENPKALDYIINVVHDSIYLEVPKADKEYWSKLLSSSMLKSWETIRQLPLFKYKDIPIDAEVEELIPK